MIVGSRMGDPNASIPTPQPVIYREMFGAHGQAKYRNNITFVSQAAYDNKIDEKLGLKK
jgi:urease subunit alpha